MARLVYSPDYGVDLGGHVFPTQKYAAIAGRFRSAGVSGDRFIEPGLPDAAAVLSVHTQRYFAACRDGHLSSLEIAQLELPWSEELFHAASLAVAGTELAADLALDHGVGLHIGGGFHHAYPDHGEGFCVFNDVACAVTRLLEAGRVSRPLIADCDLHHGNGTAAIFGDVAAVTTYSIHEQGIYPFHKPPSTVDVGLEFGTGDDEYLTRLRSSLAPLIETCEPDIVLYVAGADPFAEDQLGSLQITKDGLLSRDRVVIEACAAGSIPLVVVLAGGYARDPDDTADIQYRTLNAASELWRG